MRKVCVITGGSSGIGFESAKLLGKYFYIIIAARNEEKMVNACNKLHELGIESTYHHLDMTDDKSIKELAIFAKKQGEVKALLHSAGMSPHMGNYKEIIDTNAYGSVILNEEFLKIMDNGVIINISSMSSYLTPGIVIPKRKFKLAFSNVNKMKKKFYSRCRLFPKKVRSGVAYGISKNFLTWFSIAFAIKAGEKNVRVICVSPGNFDTPMGNLEKGEASKYNSLSCLKRSGNPKEIAYLLNSIIDSNNSYLTGVDIKCDGGVFAFNENKKLIDKYIKE